MEDSAKSGIHQLIILLMRNLYAVVPLYVAAGAGLGTLPRVLAQERRSDQDMVETLDVLVDCSWKYLRYIEPTWKIEHSL